MQAKAVPLNYSDDHPLLFGIDIDYPPLEYVDDNGTPSGYDVVFTKRLMQRMNLPFTYSPNTWENISDDVLSGRVDLGMMVYSPYRKDLTNYSRAVFRLYYQIVFRDEDNVQMDMRNLAGKSIAYMASRPIKDTLTSVGVQLNEVKDLAKATVDLSKGKYDAVICFRYQAKYIIEKYKLTNLTTADLTLTPREYCYVSHDKMLIDSINVVLEQMEEEGVISEVYDIASTFDRGFRIPRWVWFLLVMLVFVFLVVFIIFQQRYQKKLRKEMELAQRSERLKTVFLGNISHALRTPLNAIIGFSDVLLDEGKEMPKEERSHLYQQINDNGRSLLYFISELLELSDIEGNNLSLEQVSVSLPEVMQSYAEEWKDELTEGVGLYLECDDVTVLVDEHYMRVVTRHILSNAVRHTAEGSVTLRASYVNHGLRVEVQDTGEGLPESLKENIFSLLSEKSTYIRKEVPGLGLTICKAIVENCKGQIGAISPEQGGTVLWYWVPVETEGDVKRGITKKTITVKEEKANKR